MNVPGCRQLLAQPRCTCRATSHAEFLRPSPLGKPGSSSCPQRLCKTSYRCLTLQVILLHHASVSLSGGQIFLLPLSALFLRKGHGSKRQHDLVKNHLMYAVREEVEVLKEQIKELLEKNSQLERENSLLKTLASPEQLEKFQSRLPTEVLCPEEQSPGAPAPAQHAGGSAV
uniref:T22D3 protein n=1 Tax=Dromaius novaehollandiae TaxID=8790 RepID=A0A8C4J2T2_DRONO